MIKRKLSLEMGKRYILKLGEVCDATDTNCTILANMYYDRVLRI
jgi:hypothetical protein